jgi:predicted nuclease of predicted toxin-antitoxin system
VRALAGDFPGSVHAIAVGLGGAPDRALWVRAAADGFVLLTKDEDFHRLSVVHGAPPKVVCIMLGNGPTREVAQLLQARAAEIRAFAAHEEATFLALG